MLPGMRATPPKRPPPTLAYQSQQSSLTNITVGNTYSFASVGIGTAAADRLVIAAVRIQGGAEIDTVTIGGVTATLAAIDFDTGIYYALVPTGTTATITVLVKTATSTSCSVGVYTLTGYINAVPYDAGNISNAASHTVLSSTWNVPLDGVLVGVSGRTGTGTVTWSGASEDYDTVVETNCGRSGAQLLQTNLPAATVTIGTTYSAAATFGKIVCAVWR
ncbi:MAG: hypothetical protein JNM12_10120 [Alphaproteobacteria bacterium]|nr:hypothetical protein [Alphaproteobacteria bacterium]